MKVTIKELIIESDSDFNTVTISIGNDGKVKSEPKIDLPKDYTPSKASEYLGNGYNPNIQPNTVAHSPVIDTTDRAPKRAEGIDDMEF